MVDLPAGGHWTDWVTADPAAHPAEWPRRALASLTAGWHLGPGGDGFSVIDGGYGASVPYFDSTVYGDARAHFNPIFEAMYNDAIRDNPDPVVGDWSGAGLCGSRGHGRTVTTRHYGLGRNVTLLDSTADRSTYGKHVDAFSQDGRWLVAPANTVALQWEGQPAQPGAPGWTVPAPPTVAAHVVIDVQADYPLNDLGPFSAFNIDVYATKVATHDWPGGTGSQRLDGHVPGETLIGSLALAPTGGPFTGTFSFDATSSVLSDSVFVAFRHRGAGGSYPPIPEVQYSMVGDWSQNAELRVTPTVTQAVPRHRFYVVPPAPPVTITGGPSRVRTRFHNRTVGR